MFLKVYQYVHLFMNACIYLKKIKMQYPEGGG